MGSVAAVSLPEVSDEELAALAASRNHWAFHQLYQRYKQPVFARLTKVIGVVPDREDVLQDIFWQLHRALPSFQNKSKLSTFLYRIASNVTCDHLRKRWRQPVFFDDDALDELAATLPDPARWSCAREQLRIMFAMLDKLKPSRRIAFVLVAVEGLSFAEAADQLGISQAAVRQRVTLARNQLEELCRREERSEARTAWRST
jgi:RNA polymerase sigma-70 factor, ECF subfamily